MKLERISHNKFKIFLTFDDLIERGLTKEDLWHDLPLVHELFQDMMYEASDELNFPLEGMLLVQVYLLQAQGMLIVVTQNEAEMDQEDDEYVEMKVMLDESREMIFYFSEFEHIIQLAHHLIDIKIVGGKVYYLNDGYYLKLDDFDILEHNREDLIAILSEFSSPSAITSFKLEEYGKHIYDEYAIFQITQHFHK